MKKENNSIHIGNHNKISNSVIGSKNNIKNVEKEKGEKPRQKLFWLLVVPIVVVVIGAIICNALGISQ